MRNFSPRLIILQEEIVKPVVFDYDVMAHDILESGKFRQFLTQVQNENRKMGQKQIDEMIQITFNDLINKMNQDISKTEENLGKYQMLQQEYVEKIETEKSDLKTDIQNVIEKFQPLLQSNPTQTDIFSDNLSNFCILQNLQSF